MSDDPVRIEQKGGLVWVTIDNPPVNATSVAVRIGLARAAETIGGMDVAAAVLRCAGRTFVAGGEIREFDAPPVEPHLPDVIEAIEDCRVPWIAAMHGSVFGGGLEIALGCAWRVAVQGTRFALPEVTLGIVPGAGGTQRLPRLVGPCLALEMATGGRPVEADVFLAAGGVDQLLPDLSDTTLQDFAEALEARPTAVRLRPVAARARDWWQAREAGVAAQAGRLDAPLEALRLVARAAEVPFATGQSEERARHLALRASPQSRALRHVFFAERQAARAPVLGEGQPPKLRGVAVIGVTVFADRLADRAHASGLSVCRAGAADDLDLKAGEFDLCIAVPGAPGPERRSMLELLRARAEPGIPVALMTEPAAPLVEPETVAGQEMAAAVLLTEDSETGLLAEIAVQDCARPEAARAALAFARRIGGVAVVANGGDTFISNRLGAKLQQAARAFGIGDLTAQRLEAIWEGLAEDDLARTVGVAYAQSVSAPDIGICRALFGVCVNEGARMVEAGLVAAPGAIDVVAIRSQRFPRWLGGPMYHAERVGLGIVAAWMDRIMAQSPGEWVVSDLLREAAQ